MSSGHTHTLSGTSQPAIPDTTAALKTSLLRPFESHAFRSLLNLASIATTVLSNNPHLPRKELSTVIEHAWQFNSASITDATYAAMQEVGDTDTYISLAPSDTAHAKTLLTSLTGAQAQLSIRVKAEYASVLGNALTLLSTQQAAGLKEAKICQPDERAIRSETAIVYLSDILPQTAVQLATLIHKTMTQLVGQVVYPTAATGNAALTGLTPDECTRILQRGPLDLVHGSFYGATPVGTLAILPGISYSETPLTSDWTHGSKRKTLALSRAVAEHQTTGKAIDIAVHEQLLKMGYNIENPAFAADVEGVPPLSRRIELLQAGLPSMARETVVKTGLFGDNSRRIPLQTAHHPLSTTTLPASAPAKLETGLSDADYVLN